MWQKIKKFFINSNVEEEHQRNMKEIEMQHKNIMKELIGLIEDMNESERLIMNEFKTTRKAIEDEK